MASFVVFALVLATSVWVGGFVVIAIVAGVARRELDDSTRIVFFRGLGRRYLGIGGGSLAVALGSGGILLVPGNLTAPRRLR